MISFALWGIAICLPFFMAVFNAMDADFEVWQEDFETKTGYKIKDLEKFMEVMDE